ncbi:MAG: altronate dehydratase family protein, partial [Victivallaceae bacterium]|nr:altronate dehydratase family protein [Victivallaceae bacterium]
TDNVEVVLSGDGDVPRGHEIAARDIRAGESIVKYGMPIGHATRDIRCGEHVHGHNMATDLAGVLEYRYEPDFRDAAPEKETLFFDGFRREDGKVGIRNHLFVIPTVGCVNRLARRLADRINAELPENVDRALALEHPYGCSQLGRDHALTRTLLGDLARHPNAGGVLVVGLGCENNTIEDFKASLGNFPLTRIRFLVAQQCEDEEAAGLEALRELARLAAADRKEKFPLSRLVVGLKCGGSDGLSGITANALIGRFTDFLAAHGGTAILTEVPEMFGAETLLMKRCRDRATFERCAKMINSFKEYFLRYGQPVSENPSPGNKAGGITTLEDKALGCTQKSGSVPVDGVLDAGELPQKPGLNLLSGPGNDMVASTLLAAAGAHLILFSTGRGTPFGTVVPTLKISSNSALAQKKAAWIDFDAGSVLDAGNPASVDEKFRKKVLAVAGGEKCVNELHGYEEIALFKDGVTL